MMGVATCLIGVLPTYESIGIAAPIMLIVLRLVQGFGVGGEWGGAVLMAIEHGHSSKRGFYGSCVQMGVPAGLLLATGVFAIFSSMDDQAFLSWGWRMPFLFGVVLLTIGMFIRFQIAESPLFAQVQHKNDVSPVPILDVFRHYPRNVLLAMGRALQRTPASTSSAYLCCRTQLNISALKNVQCWLACGLRPRFRLWRFRPSVFCRIALGDAPFTCAVQCFWPRSRFPSFG